MAPAFSWLFLFLKELESKGVPVVYLRNHENLPEEIGNDVDLLVPEQSLAVSERLLTDTAAQHGWRHLRTVKFGPLSLFFCDALGEHFMHVDLFSSLELHWIPFADTGRMLSRRRWNGLVHVPDPLDEVFLNVTTRLFYHGVVREKHRVQAAQVLALDSSERFAAVVREHVGAKLAARLAPRVLANQWEVLEAEAGFLRHMLLGHALRARPAKSLRSLLRYAYRVLRRLLFPPGPFIVFEGVDGVGKSTLIDGVIPLFKEITGRSDTLLFHWKPNRSSLRVAGTSPGPASNPRSQQPHPTVLSALLLGYHWLGFWIGYLRYILPARAKNRAIIGDRYAYELFLDPGRLRLNLPQWLLRLASRMVPQPGLVICLVADPATIVARKDELNIVEITRYQDELKRLRSCGRRFALLHADDNLNGNTNAARACVLSLLYPAR